MKQGSWFSKDIRYGYELGYVMLQLPPVHLPEFSYEGIEYEAKGELHCSLLCVKKLAEAFLDSDTAVKRLEVFVEEFVKNNSITFKGFTNLAYICEEDDVKSVVIGANVEGIEQLFAALRTHFSELAMLAPPALHVTLYKYNHAFGIGIQNEAQLRELCRPIPIVILPKTIKEIL